MYLFLWTIGRPFINRPPASIHNPQLTTHNPTIHLPSIIHPPTHLGTLSSQVAWCAESHFSSICLSNPQSFSVQKSLRSSSQHSSRFPAKHLSAWEVSLRSTGVKVTPACSPYPPPFPPPPGLLEILPLPIWHVFPPSPSRLSLELPVQRNLRTSTHENNSTCVLDTGCAAAPRGESPEIGATTHDRPPVRLWPSPSPYASGCFSRPLFPSASASALHLLPLLSSICLSHTLSHSIHNSDHNITTSP
ncbi:hypothetical protein BDP81DRAFT_92320 [Colletotrichum phormii]|uniref:Uncharacterized protein n=1 Tax=Colletotrichum phormii TaxID=359342 RepID=A0AAJ0A1Z4_9PEZI|nr:uncharacterized protein BDP81DRAFT_92320 [Colletotrichum phormii]KAK1654984.1 hypothetical protein BDP81DRAFT_92320 [Colletotrichum phormii]